MTKIQQKQIDYTNENFSKHEVLTKTAYKLERKLRRLWKRIEQEIEDDLTFRLPNVRFPIWEC